MNPSRKPGARLSKPGNSSTYDRTHARGHCSGLKEKESFLLRILQCNMCFVTDDLSKLQSHFSPYNKVIEVDLNRTYFTVTSMRHFVYVQEDYRTRLFIRFEVF